LSYLANTETDKQTNKQKQKPAKTLPPWRR